MTLSGGAFNERALTEESLLDAVPTLLFIGGGALASGAKK